MLKILRILSFLFLFMLSGCFTKGESQLSKALSGAVKEKKVSKKKMESILKEYEMLRDDDRNKARVYAEQIIQAIEMGADSSHIDVIRRKLSRESVKVSV